MSASVLGLLAFVALTLGLIIPALLYRIGLVFTGKAPANSWTRGAKTREDPAIITRLEHAHLNCLENLLPFAAVLLAAFASNQLEVINGLIWVFVGLRFGQSAVHLIGVSHWLVFLRANLFVGQIAILVYWMLKLAGLA